MKDVYRCFIGEVDSSRSDIVANSRKLEILKILVFYFFTTIIAENIS
jgi:hypothetical protein